MDLRVGGIHVADGARQPSRSSGRQPAARSPNPSARAHQGSSRPTGGSPPRSTSRYGGGSSGPGASSRPTHLQARPTGPVADVGGYTSSSYSTVLGVGVWLARDNIAPIFSDLPTAATSSAPTAAPSRARTVTIPPTATPTLSPSPAANNTLDGYPYSHTNDGIPGLILDTSRPSVTCWS